MRNTLLIRVGAGYEGACQWLSLGADGRPAGGVHQGSLDEAAAAAGGLRVVALLPGIDCLLAEVRIPGRNRQKLLRAAPFALEEQLTEDVEDLHFAMGPPLPDGAYPVAVVAIRHMETIMAAFREVGLELQQLIPETLAVPYAAGSTCALIDGDMTLVRSGLYAGFAVDTDNLGLLLAGQLEAGDDEPRPPLRLHAPRGGELPELSALEADIQVEHFGNNPLELLAEGLKSPYIDMLQGTYSRSQELGRLWRPWRATAALLLAGFLLSQIVTGVDYYRLSKEQQALKARIEQIYKQTFPGTKRVVNPRVQMQQQLEQLQRRQGAGGQFMVLLARSGDILRKAKDIEISGANYRAGRLDVDLTAASLQTLDELKQTLSRQGLAVEIQSATTGEGKRVKSRLRIQESSA